MNIQYKNKVSWYQRWLDWEQQEPVFSFLLEFSILMVLFIGLFSMAIMRLPVAIQWQNMPSYFWTQGQAGIFLKGLWQTFQLSVLALMLMLPIGYFAALLRISRLISLQWLSRLYIQLVRNTPLLVQLYVGYFVLSPLFGFSSFQTALLVLSLFEGAYTAEIIRNAIQNIATGQQRAAVALGLNSWQVQFLIVQPQALYNALPVLANQGVSLIKNSALASAIGVFELSRSAQRVQEQTFLPFEPWLAVAMVYFTLTFVLSLGVKRLEGKFLRK